MNNIITIKEHITRKIKLHNEKMLNLCEQATKAMDDNLLAYSKTYVDLACAEHKIIKDLKKQLNKIYKKDIIYTITSQGEGNYAFNISPFGADHWNTNIKS